MNQTTQTTGIRLEVPQSLYERLQAEQEKRRFNTGKKPALALIIMDYCLEKLDENDVQQSILFSEQPGSEINMIDSHTEKRLRLWEEQLFMKQKSSQERENRLNEREKEILQEKNTVLEIKSKLLDEREKFQQKTFEGTESIIEQKLLQNELKYKDEKIQRLENELSMAKGRSPRNQ
ncbi:MAG: hypothetical protein HY951_19180 [Bacteroidia bacterium]|nr:hypothetical protein [Bacteroidia bacterium]